MIEELKRIEDEQLLDLIDNAEWQSLDVDYEDPRVERVWIQLGDNRLSLHVIHPCEPGASLWHPHPWKAAFHVLPKGGTYEQGMGVMNNGAANQYMKMEFRGNMYYDMTDANCYHYVRPLIAPVYTIMLSGPVIWPENKWKATADLKPLSSDRKEEILSIFKSIFYELATRKTE